MTRGAHEADASALFISVEQCFPRAKRVRSTRRRLALLKRVLQRVTGGAGPVRIAGEYALGRRQARVSRRRSHFFGLWLMRRGLSRGRARWSRRRRRQGFFDGALVGGIFPVEEGDSAAGSPAPAVPGPAPIAGAVAVDAETARPSCSWLRGFESPGASRPRSRRRAGAPLFRRRRSGTRNCACDGACAR